jgi:hypothetical protein
LHIYPKKLHHPDSVWPNQPWWHCSWPPGVDDAFSLKVSWIAVIHLVRTDLQAAGLIKIAQSIWTMANNQSTSWPRPCLP